MAYHFKINSGIIQAKVKLKSCPAIAQTYDKLKSYHAIAQTYSYNLPF